MAKGVDVVADSKTAQNKSTPSGQSNVPGDPRWWLNRLSQRLMARHTELDVLEDYACGNHPLPNGDKRYVKALQDLQKKSRTNYCELIIKAVTQRMRVKGFRFGPEGEADEDAKRIWDTNDMDLYSQVMINNAATYGVTYGMVSPPDEFSEEPYITLESPYQCILEADPLRPSRNLAGLKLWVDSILGHVMAIVFTQKLIYTFVGMKVAGMDSETMANWVQEFRNNPSVGRFELMSVQDNPLDNGQLPLQDGWWQPEWPEGRAEHQGVLWIQDRVNHTVLDRLIIQKSQAYRQRWATGVELKKKAAGPGGRSTRESPPWDPGADQLWISQNAEASFGDFEQADITQLLQAITEDVGHMAAISQTPATYLMNRMVNVSGDTLTQDQSALISKIKGGRHLSMGWFFERLMKIAFAYKGDTAKAKEVEATTLWADPELRSMAEKADAFSKLIGTGAPGLALELASEIVLDLSPDQIKFAVEKAEEMKQEQIAREDEMLAQQTDAAIKTEKAKPKPAGASAGGGKGKPSPSKK